MNRQSVSQTHHQKATANSTASGLLQRKCACGRHTPSGGECMACKNGGLNKPLQARLKVGEMNGRYEHKSTRAQRPTDSRFGFAKPIFQPHTEALAVPVIQAKRKIGEPNDKFEQEADHISKQVMRMPEPSLQGACPCGGGCPKCSNSSGGHAHYSALRSLSRSGASRLSKDQILRQEGSRYYQTAPNLPPNQPAVGGFLFCDPPLYDVAQIRRALDTAKLWVASAILRLNQFTMGGQTIEEETAVRVALLDNFNITENHPRVTLLPKTPLETILDNFVTIEGALNQTLQFYCTTACRPGDLAWVLGNPGALGLPRGIINICRGFFGCDPLKQASTIIHERAHDALGAKDHEYEVSSLYDSLPTIMALENAESYAVAARQIYHDGIHGPGLSCSGASRIGPLKFLEPMLRPSKAPRFPTVLGDKPA